MNTVILVPVLRRPHRVAPLLSSLAANTPEPHSVLFLCNSDDADEINAITPHLTPDITRIIIPPRQPGDYARKINLGYRSTTEPYIFLAADDLLFHPNWLSLAIRNLSKEIHVVGTNDLGNPRVMAGHHSTHSLLTREYANRYGTIDRQQMVLHEGYDHTFTDDEFIQTARARGMYHYESESIVEHLHPNWNKAEWDEVYSIADQSLITGRRIFNRRRRLWQHYYIRHPERRTERPPMPPRQPRMPIRPRQRRARPAR